MIEEFLFGQRLQYLLTPVIDHCIGVVPVFGSDERNRSPLLDGKLRLTDHRSCIGQGTLFQLERGSKPYDICVLVAFASKGGVLSTPNGPREAF